MANLVLLSGFICAILINFCIVIDVAAENDIHFYALENNPKYHTDYSLILLDNNEKKSSNIVKRDAQEKLMLNKNNKSKPLLEQKDKSTNKSKTEEEPSTDQSIISSPVLPKKHLLGENGTGQLIKNITSATAFKAKKLNIPQNPSEQFNNNETISISQQNQTTNNNNDYDTLPVFENEDMLNKTLIEQNFTEKNDTHLYYNSTFTTDESKSHFYYVNLSSRPEVKISELLSTSHRRAATIKLSFEFPFYGHPIQNVTIATGGFIYTGDYVHSWLAATQYIAPLMANFDTSISNDSFIKYLDNGTAFTVEWHRVRLQEKPNDGKFTFQVTLFKNGDIVFVYENVPFFIKQIEDDHHPVKVGLSDAYIMDRTIFFVRRKTIYEYHRVNFYKEEIRNWTSIYLKALPTCLDSKDCNTCLTRKIPTFLCMWCPVTKRCSNGLDRYRQQWIMKNCDTKKLLNDSMCSHIPNSDASDDSDITYIHDSNEYQQKIENRPNGSSRLYNNKNQINASNNKRSVSMGESSVIAMIFLIAMSGGLALWVFYAYRYPHTTSGQILIRYRPSQWRWRRGEARYTAATIHM